MNREPPQCNPWNDRLVAECDVYPMSFNRPIPPGVPCHYCGGDSTTRDHIVPDAIGGVRSWWNLVPSCWPCNVGKADRQSCSCMFCLRAIALWGLGYRHARLTRQEKVRAAKRRREEA